MKSKNTLRDSIFAAAPGHGGFTITELLIAVTILSFVIAGVVSANLFGMKMLRVSENKLIASGGARKAIGEMADEIRNANRLYVGNVSSGICSAVPDGVTQSGDGVLIYPSTNQTQYILYYLNISDNTLRRSTSTTNKTEIVARSITNTVLCTGLDCFGNILTNSSQMNRTVHLDLEFYQPKTFGVLADSYSLQSSMTRRLK